VTFTIDVGQHYSPELSDDIMRDLDLVFDRRFVPAEDKRLRGVILGTAISELSTFFAELHSKPNVVVFGDAASVVAGAFAAYNSELQLIHIEAGARRDPRELEHHNSVIVDRLANIRLAYSERAISALRDEHLELGTYLVGDVAYEWYQTQYHRLFQEPRPGNSAPILVSMHRPANMDRPTLTTVAESLVATGREVRWLSFPRAKPFLGLVENLGATIVGPFSHSESMTEMAHAAFLFTDSGGLSREAHYFGCPVIMRRDLGGWPELAAAGFLYPLTGRSREAVDKAVSWALATRMPASSESPLVVPGGGAKIVELVLQGVR
jgi:UDP-N-acetylglucosamine 2-epimerase